MPAKRLREFLDGEGIRYVTVSHSPAFTMSEIAHQAHISGKEVAKTVIVKIDDVMAMAVVPSNRRVDLEQLRERTSAGAVELASEDEFRKSFPGCEVGAMPPFGNLYEMDVYVAPELGEWSEIAFNAGSHSELMRLDYRDFERLVHPKVLTFATTP